MTSDIEKKEEIPESKKLLAITDRYLVDLECLREMFSTVMPVLQEQDKNRSAKIEEVIERLGKVSGPEVTKNNQTEGEDGPIDNEEKTEEESSDLTDQYKDIETLVSSVGKIKRAETLFKKQSIVSIVSRFDEFLGSFLEIALEQNPEWLKFSEKTITYKELIDLKSVDTAIKGVISKEVEQLLRASHEEQIRYVDDKLKLGIHQHFSKLACFLEVAERRNLFVHTGGLVSTQYLNKCKGFGISDKETVEGQELDVTESYFEEAFYAYFEIGLRIGQAAFRRLFLAESGIADTALNKLAIKFLNHDDNSLVIIITNYDLNIPNKLRSDDSEDEYFARINRAIAQKRLGLDFEKDLEGHPWKAFHPKYSLCLHVLRDEFLEAANMMNSHEVIRAIDIVGFRTWPIFREFRSSIEFQAAYRQNFGHDYARDPERDAPIIQQQEEVLGNQSEEVEGVRNVDESVTPEQR
jgi:hypothetical protein